MKLRYLLPLLVACAPARTASTASTTSPSLQSIADDELARVMRDWKPEGAAIVIVSPQTGEVLADAHARTAPAYVTGSTLKSLILAGALEDGIVKPDDSFDLEQGRMTYAGQPLEDASSNGVVSVPDMLAVSSNVGFAKLFDRMGGARLGHWLHAFHFGEAPGTVPATIVDHSYEGVTVAIGEQATATPTQVAKAYATIANGGEYPGTHERVVKPETAKTVTKMLEGVVYGEKGTGRNAKVEGVRVAGKTGTAEWKLATGELAHYASFAGFVPSESPRFVILVGVDRPKGEHAYGGAVAAPVFSRVATRALARNDP